MWMARAERSGAAGRRDFGLETVFEKGRYEGSIAIHMDLACRVVQPLKLGHPIEHDKPLQIGEHSSPQCPRITWRFGKAHRPGSFTVLARLKPLNPLRGGTFRQALLAGAVAILDRMPGERARAFSTNVADAREGKMRRGDEFATRGKI